MLVALALVVAGLFALVGGGEILIRGAVRLAERAGVSPLLVGLVIIGFGTSMPELVTSVEASLNGVPELAWGNIIGSNLANSLLILGAAALVSPMLWQRDHPLRDPAIALLASVALLALAATGLAGRGIAVALIAALLVYIVWCYRAEKKPRPAKDAGENLAHDKQAARELADPDVHGEVSTWLVPVAQTIGGFILLIAGGQALVSGAIDLARIVGMTETVIGLTVVAFGTSLPELVTTVIAARKGESGIAFGNVVGSNLYNALGIGGATMLVAPQAIPAALVSPDLWMVVAAAAFLLGWPSWRGRVGRITGAVLIAIYCGYIASAVLLG